MGNDNINAVGPLSAAFSPEASACFHICSPPGVPVAEVAKRLQEQCNQVSVWCSSSTEKWSQNSTYTDQIQQ